jgi:hypothetical protein
VLAKRVLVLVAIGAAALVWSAWAPASVPVDLYNGGNLHESVGQADTKDLRQGVVYEASTFPIRVRFRPPDGLWGGVQLISRRFRFVQVQHFRKGSFRAAGRGFITLETATGRTPSVAATIRRLHRTPKIDAGPITTVRVAGYAGKSFDATITGVDPQNPGIALAPFTRRLPCGYCENTLHHQTRDYKFAQRGQLFRFIAINVRGKTVVIYLESKYARPHQQHTPSEAFPTFLPFANELLSKLRFPR